MSKTMLVPWFCSRAYGTRRMGFAVVLATLLAPVFAQSDPKCYANNIEFAIKERREMPDLLGCRFDSLNPVLSGLGYPPKRVPACARLPIDTIIRPIVPPAGSKLEPGTVITLTVSNASPCVIDVLGGAAKEGVVKPLPPVLDIPGAATVPAEGGMAAGKPVVAKPQGPAAAAIEKQSVKKTELPAPLALPQAQPVAKHGPKAIKHATPQKTIAQTNDLTSYSVNVSATERLTRPGVPGEMTVWIGDPQKLPQVTEGMSSKTEALGVVGETAKVTPFVRGGIDVQPTGSICGRVDPSGSSFKFKLTPIDSGKFSVGANIELFNSADCTGSPVPKSTKEVAVEVTVCASCVAMDGLGTLLNHAWKAFVEFWDKLLVIFFALLLFLTRKKIYTWFGFESK